MTLQDILQAITPKTTGGIYNQDGIHSAGGSLQMLGLPQVGGTVGIDNGQPFANANVNHQPVFAVGPNDTGLVDNGGQQAPQFNPDIMKIIQALLGGGGMGQAAGQMAPQMAPAVQGGGLN